MRLKIRGYALHTLAFVGGEPMAAPASVEIPVEVQPGSAVDLSVSLTAPTTPGTYRSEWKLKVDNGSLIGVGSKDTALYALIVVGDVGRANGPTLHAAQRATPPKIDGYFDDWSGLPDKIDQVVFGAEQWSGTSDQSATFALAWDASNLYLAAKVVDDVHAQTQLGAQIFKGDSLEILLDADLAGDFDSRSLSADDFQLGLTPGENKIGGPDAYLWYPRAQAGKPNGVVVMARQDESGSGYYLEAAMPWSVFSLTPAAEDRYGFVLSSSDNDAPGAAEQHSLISTDPVRALTDPTTWGTLVLDR